MSPRRRADAAENRARIVAVARAAVADGGDEELKLNAIAKRAGVGQGTLYRHFPTREDLLAEVYRSRGRGAGRARPAAAGAGSRRSSRSRAGSTASPSTRASSAG